MACFKVNFNVDVNKSLSGLKPTLRLGRPKSGIKKLKKKMAILRARRDDINNQIREAESKGKIPTNEVSQWLQEVGILEGKVADIERDFERMSHRVLSNPLSINKRVAVTLHDADGLMSYALDRIATDLSRPEPGIEPGIQKLEKEMARLRAKRDDIKNQIREVAGEGKIPTKKVIQWLMEVETLEGQVINIKQDFQSISCFCCNCVTHGTSQIQQVGDQVRIIESSNCCSILSRVTKKLGEANELMSLAGALNPITTVPPPKPSVMLSISHRPPVGMESYVEDIVGFIDSREGNIIGIYGMGGVGKTTILVNIQQYYLHNYTKFDSVIWIVASKDCQLKRLQMDIAKSLRLKTLQESDDERTCGDKLSRYLKNRNCLLLLDDIWGHLDLKLLGMAQSATERGQQQQPHKVVVFTTRYKSVCVQMKARKETIVNCLDQIQAWQLFEKNSNRDVLNSDAGIKFVAQQLAKECAGLPLALITVARAMLGKDSQDAWNYALHQIKDKHEWTTIDPSEDLAVIYNAFKLSYVSLRNDSLRECLLCCALWPEDHDIHIFEELIPCWIGCGIIREFNIINEAFNEGCSHLEALMDASLLKYSSRRQDYYEAQHVKMHDIIRYMTLLMISSLNGNGTKWIVKSGNGLHSLPRQEEWQEAKRASFMHNHNLSLPEYISTFPKLSMLMLQGNNLWRIPPTLFTNMPFLTYLNLSNNRGIRNLPREIGNLTELQYLNLSSTGIRSLPLEFGCLRKLEYLLLRYNNLETVPNGTISKLLKLKWLDIREMFPISEWWWNELQYFTRLHQLSLGIDINPVNLKKLDMLPNVSVWKLTVSGWESLESSKHNLDTLQWSHRLSDNLECLTILDVPGDKLMMNADVDCESSFRCLKTLYFISLEQLEKIWLNGVGFDNLRDLRIVGCFKLKDVNWVLQLPCLKLLDITASWEMDELISNVGSSNSSFGVKMLILNEMKNLHSIVHQPLHFPCLEYMCVYSCPRLTKLPFGAEILKSGLKEIRGDQTWWDNLDWNDNNDKDSLTHYFRQQFP